jgi:hypothetical protein
MAGEKGGYGMVTMQEMWGEPGSFPYGLCMWVDEGGLYQMRVTGGGGTYVWEGLVSVIGAEVVFCEGVMLESNDVLVHDRTGVDFTFKGSKFGTDGLCFGLRRYEGENLRITVMVRENGVEMPSERVYLGRDRVHPETQGFFDIECIDQPVPGEPPVEEPPVVEPPQVDPPSEIEGLAITVDDGRLQLVDCVLVVRAGEGPGIWVDGDGRVEMHLSGYVFVPKEVLGL